MESGSYVCATDYLEDPFEGLTELQREDAFDSVDRLAVHTSLDTDDNPYVCIVCGMSFKQKRQLTVHMRDHNSETHYVCKVCSETFITIYGLKEHLPTCNESSEVTFKSEDDRVKDEHDDSLYSCQFCIEVCESKEMLKTHISHSHSSKHVCDNCGMVLSSSVALREHMNAHTELKREAATSRSIVDWIQNKLDNKQYNCTFCVKVFKSEEALKAHFKREHTSCTCDKCGKVLSSSVSLRNHKNVVHKEAKPFACSVCDKRCKRKADLIVHLRTHTGERPYTCEMCFRSFINLSNFKRHLCFVSREVPTEGSIDERHEDKRYNCSLCMRVFKSEKWLDAHFARYHISRACDKCGKVLASSCSLRNHKNVVHKEAKPFACTTCEKRFKRKADLKVHLRTHTGERPYTCEMCSRSFINLSNFKNHLCRAPCKESIEGSRDERVKDKHDDKQ